MQDSKLNFQLADLSIFQLTFTYFWLTFTIFIKTINMEEILERAKKKHVGKNLQKVRVYLGVKQDALATDLGMTQQAVSKIEQQDEIEDEMLGKIAEVLGVSPDLIKNFDEEKAVYNINNFRDNTLEQGATAIAQQFNPVEKIVELYERLLSSEREKIEILSKSKQ
jgi:transcriptional regulator with XRE-family HTH domain